MASKLLESVAAQLNGDRFPARSKMVVSSDIGEMPNDPNLYGYTINAAYGQAGVCRAEDFHYVKENFLTALRLHIYGDFIEQLLDLQRSIYEQDDQRSLQIISDIIKEVRS